MGSQIAGIGSYLPEKKVSRDEISVSVKEKYAGFPDKWFDIPTYRHHASERESAVYMGVKACEEALKQANVQKSEVDFLMSYSAVDDRFWPHDSQSISTEMGLDNATALNLNQACGSFISMLKVGTALIESGFHKKILLVTTTNWVNRCHNPERNRSPLGDGAAAVLLVKSEQKSLVYHHEYRIGKFNELAVLGSHFVEPGPHYLEMSVAEDLQDMVEYGIVKRSREMLANDKIEVKSIDWFLTHQIGFDVLKRWQEGFEIPPEKHLTTFDMFSNCMAANIPLGLAHYTNVEKKIKPGDRLFLFTVGGGMHVASMIWDL